MKHILAKLAPPRFVEPDKNRQAELLNAVSLVLIVILGFLLLLNIFYDIGLESAVNPVLFGLIVSQALAQVMIRSGYVRQAGISLLFLSWLGITWFALLADGVRDVVLFAYITILLGAGYMFGWRSVLITSVGSIFSVWVLTYYEVKELIEPTLTSPSRVALYLTSLLILISFQIYYVINTLKRSLAELTQQVQARQDVETRLREEQEKLSFALNAANMGTWSWNIETGIVDWSDQIEPLFGMEKGTFDGKYSTYLSIIFPEDLPLVENTIQRTLVDPDFTYVVEHRIVLPDGGRRWLEGRGNVYRNQDGQPIRMAGTVVDITDRKKLDLERERLLGELGAKNAELERFVYTVSHDLKSPLVTIVGFLGYLEDDFKTGNEQALQKDMERIYRAAFKMQDLLQDLLDLSRVGRMMNEPQVIPFDVLLNEALELTEGRLRERGVEIRIQPDFPHVHGDPQRLLEVVQNLIDNAAKYMGDQPAPCIEIGSTGYENGDPIFYVRDNGIGIDPEHHERIFGLFNKLDPNVEGTGIGLALVKRIVEFHGGRIWVESAEGQGATFWFTLPVGEQAAGEDAQESHS